MERLTDVELDELWQVSQANRAPYLAPHIWRTLLAEVIQARKVLTQLKDPLREMPDNVSWDNRKGVADACLQLIEKVLS